MITGKTVNIVCWKWRHPSYRTTFLPGYVNVLYSMLKKYYKRPFRLICITDEPDGIDCETFPIWDDLKEMQNPNGFNLPCCYKRLKIFSGDVTRAMGIQDGERVVSIDLDVVITGNLNDLFDFDHEFIAWKGIGHYQPDVYNGSLFMFRAGALPWLWDEFDPVQSPRQSKENKFFGSDQGWLSFRLANPSSPGWGINDGVYSYSRDIRGKFLPDNARIVFFNGKHKPWDDITNMQSPWVRKFWRLEEHALQS